MLELSVSSSYEDRFEKKAMVFIVVDIARGRILITFSKLFLPYILSEEIDDLKKISKVNIELFQLFGFSAIDCIVSYVLVFFLHKWLAFRLLLAKNLKS